jgi:hypothetical protein
VVSGERTSARRSGRRMPKAARTGCLIAAERQQ